MLDLEGKTTKTEGFTLTPEKNVINSVKKVCSYIIEKLKTVSNFNIKNNSELSRFIFALTFSIEQRKTQKQSKIIREVSEYIEQEFQENNWFIVGSIYEYMLYLQNTLLRQLYSIQEDSSDNPKEFQYVA